MTTSDSIWIAKEGETIQDVFSAEERCAFLEHGCLSVGDALEYVPPSVLNRGAAGHDQPLSYDEKLRKFPYHVQFDNNAGGLLYRAKAYGLEDELIRLGIGRLLGALTLMPSAMEGAWSNVRRDLRVYVKHQKSSQTSPSRTWWAEERQFVAEVESTPSLFDDQPVLEAIVHFVPSSIVLAMEKVGFVPTKFQGRAHVLHPKGLERLAETP